MSFIFLIFEHQKVSFISTLALPLLNKIELWNASISTCSMLLVLFDFNLIFLWFFGLIAFSLLSIWLTDYHLLCLVTRLLLKCYFLLRQIINTSKSLVAYAMFLLFLASDINLMLGLTLTCFLAIFMVLKDTKCIIFTLISFLSLAMLFFMRIIFHSNNYLLVLTMACCPIIRIMP